MDDAANIIHTVTPPIFIGVSLIIYFKKVIYYHIIREQVVKKNPLKFH
ncbi:hypothetical protein NMBH4476_2065 [Neisseria meningitidis H44/76]|uniref:Uncharacterized protein n=2 Tax=Neisseria meningitidis TaxID=487 RepID=E6MZV9_NEIMH|nr:hypothetical protein NMBH4476_2065 [Neisseria meningitidis H44/76]ADY98554.1 hypothetical protein NMBM01240149_2025 [Neisseria meningitidis M01-240149]ADZ02474.1 hypothetical protein NMBM04240196_2062 [Neisseria meningitidis M04-240196]ADZ04421.1 hypothetical protein NMBNZ0533_2053 [Neisseria meningitidis NZ-05/33]EGC57971.1 hypothetical protein NMBM0579_2017 [Neisseria meningitidis M0579]KER38660.1 hypothetical protein F528_2398 [Neisseria meningitidis 992008]CCA45788.1 hypothetical prote